MKQEIHMTKMCDTVTVQVARASFNLVRSIIIIIIIIIIIKKKNHTHTAILVTWLYPLLPPMHATRCTTSSTTALYQEMLHT
jgi:hypothetical protein